MESDASCPEYPKVRGYGVTSSGHYNQLDGFIVKGEERKVCKLLKSLYGLK
jgi:hypothetical protein